MSSTSSQLKNEILRAGAGAGKTTKLTETFLGFASQFKLDHGKFPRIVVTTFTRKATQELKERLLNKSLELGRDDLFHYVSSKSQVQISTIHGVLSVFLARYGASIGLTPDYKIMAESEIRKGARKIIRKYLLENPNLQELLEEYDFPVLENALLTYFGESVNFTSMQFIPELELEIETERVLSDISGKLQRVCTAISHETTNDKWQEYTQSLLNFSWKMKSESWMDFFSRLENFWEFTSKPAYRKASAPFSASLNEELEELRERIDKLIEEPRYRPSFWQKHQRNCELFNELAQNFCRDFLATKLEKGFLSMSDLETLASKIIRDTPEAAQQFSQEWDYWMVDEYQDTSPAQVELLRHLIGTKPVFIVGDPQQSIYLFRGARAEVFNEKVSEIQANNGVFNTKLINYRSTPEVLDFFNYYFTRLSKDFAAMTPNPDKKRVGNQNPVVQILLSETTDADPISQEILNTVFRVQELLADGVSPEQICVLGRTHKTLEDIAKVAQDFGVPLQLHSGSGFYERREVLDALAILKFLVNPHDNANFVSLLRSPWLVISDSELMEYCHSSRHSYWKEAQKDIESKDEIHPLKLLRTLLKMSEKQGLTATLKKALKDLGLFDYSSRIDSSGRREANLWKVVALLSEEERRPGFNFLDFLDSSLETLSADEGGEDADATPVIEPKRVNFMTVHASKGLQFDQVIVPGMGQDPRASHAPVLSIHEKTGLWSLKVRIEETQSMASSVLADQITEELRTRESAEFLRVLYVALTRAKSGVTLLWDKKIGKKSWAALCPLNIEEGFHQEDTFSYLVRVGNNVPQKMDEQLLSKKELRPIWQATEAVSRPKYISVTELAAQEVATSSGGTRRLNNLSAGLNRAQQGTNAHRMFEALKYTTYEELLEIGDEDLKKPLQFIAQTTQLPLLSIIEKGYVEWGFVLQNGNTFVQGQIDLWGIVDGELWVVDYKTGSQKYSDVALKQLKIYAWALGKLNYLDGVTRLKVAVVYPLDEVVKVEEYQSFSALEAEVGISD